MSTTSFKADHGSVESKSNDPGPSHSVSRQYARIVEAPQQQTVPGRSAQMLRYLNDTCSGSERPVTEALQDPSHVPGTQSQMSPDNPIYSTLSHCDESARAPPHKIVLAEIGARFSDYQQVRPAKLDPVDVASTAPARAS